MGMRNGDFLVKYCEEKVPWRATRLLGKNVVDKKLEKISNQFLRVGLKHNLE